MLLTCCVRGAVRVPGVLASVGVSSPHCHLHNVREGPIANLIGGRDLHQVHVPWLQLLQQGHCMASWKRQQNQDSEDLNFRKPILVN